MLRNVEIVDVWYESFETKLNR